MIRLPRPSVALGLLVAGILITRTPMIAGPLHLQDASWAAFFLGGIYLRKQWRWAFPMLMAIAVLVDYVSIQYLGVSNYCATVAYWFLVPAYASLWLGGAWIAPRLALDLRSAARLAASLFVAVSVCFLISNASFYWIGGRVADPTWAGWTTNFFDWYWRFLQVPAMYVGLVAVIHGVAAQLFPSPSADREERVLAKR
jgi:hypothetical protein